MLNLKPPQNPNYCATVVELQHFVPLIFKEWEIRGGRDEP
jgi:hypothetical protein